MKLSVLDVYNFLGKSSLLLFILIILFALANFFIFGPPTSNWAMFFGAAQIGFNILAIIWIATGSFCASYFLYKKVNKEAVSYYPFVSIPFAIGLFIFLGFLLQMLKLTGVL